MNQRDSILDLVRGSSALLVMLGHLRGFIFLDFSDLTKTGILTKGFYFITGLGHQAVMVFFVLSGYFVGGSVLSGLAKNRFSWSDYTISRLTRLWVVLVPALVLTLCIDTLGSLWNTEAYAGGYAKRYMSGPSDIQPAAYDVLAFIGNLGFVQTVSVPVYGSNGPLWSLANEFWYYVLFPLATVAVWRMIWPVDSNIMRSKRFAWFFSLAFFGVIIIWLPFRLVMGGGIWLMGAGVWWGLSEKSSELRLQSSFWIWRILGGGLFLCALVASKTGYWLGSDYAVGAAFALWLLTLPGSWRMKNGVAKIVTGFSEISYTLYVVHFPLLFFVAVVVLKGRQFSTDVQGFIWFAGLSVVILLIAGGMWWLFERNTAVVRRVIKAKLRSVP